ncbi:MAG: type II toxin-antitoxin system PemK/MazF family toxin [Verrucomicrobiales bacterium]
MVNRDPCPNRGDIGWLTMSPQQGREQAGRRSAICISPRIYNRKSGLAVFCPITSKTKGYPFEVPIDAKGISGVVLADQLKSLDWRKRDFDFIAVANDEQLSLVVERASTLIGSEKSGRSGD